MNKERIIELLESIVKDRPTAEMIVERLSEEGVLHIGHGDADIDNVTNTFVEVFGTTKTTRQDRWAANRLIKKYGAQAVVGIIRLLAEHATEQYAPVIASVTQLETKWVNVLNFLRTNGKDSVIIE